MTLRSEEIEAQATRLYEQSGAQAIATAAQRAQAHEAKGEDDAAHDWRRVEARLREYRGPRQS